MATSTFGASDQGGTKLTVRDFTRDPTLLRTTLVAGVTGQFIAESLFRDAGDIPSGILKFSEGDPLFAADSPELVEEFGEIPVLSTELGQYQAVFTSRIAGAVVISEQMRTRNQMNVLTKKIGQVKNTFIKAYDTAALALLMSKLATQAGSAVWTTAATLVRYDVAKAIETVSLNTDAYGNIYGFAPDTIVVHPSRVAAMLYNTDIDRVYTNTDNGERPIYKGQISKELVGLKIMKNQFLDPTKAIVLESGTVGGIGDERAFRVTDTYEIKQRETWRADASRISAMVVDQPKAGVVITGI